MVVATKGRDRLSKEGIFFISDGGFWIADFAERSGAIPTCSSMKHHRERIFLISEFGFGGTSVTTSRRAGADFSEYVKRQINLSASLPPPYFSTTFYIHLNLRYGNI